MKKKSSKIKYMVIIAIVAIAIAAIVSFMFFSKNRSVEIRDDPPWYFPAVLEIDPGTKVTWNMKSSTIHPVMTVEGPVEFHSGHFIKSWSYTFRKPGVYVYICPIHPYMKGVIGVGQKVPKEKIVITGSSRFDYLKHLRYDKESIRKDLNIDKNKKIILFGTQAQIVPEREEMLSCIMNSLEDEQLIIKLRQNDDINFYNSKINKFNSKKILVIKDYDLYKLFSISDVMITISLSLAATVMSEPPTAFAALKIASVILFWSKSTIFPSLSIK